jgi:hypothetical protein
MPTTRPTHNDRPTVVPAAWPTTAELCPLRPMAYPVAPNTDRFETMRPVGGAA